MSDEAVGPTNPGLDSDEELTMKMIIEAGFFQDIVDALDALVEEATFNFLEGMFRVWVQDPANVAAVFMDIPTGERDAIQHYDVQEGGFKMGVKLKRFDELLGYVDGDDLIQVEFGKKHNWRFNITMPNVDVDLAGIDPESMRFVPDRPGVELPAHYSLKGSSVNDAADLNDMYADHTTIVVEDHQVRFIGTGDNDSGTYSLEEGEGELEFTTHPNERVESMFSLEYLTSMSKVLKDYDEVEMKSGDEMPMIIDSGMFEYMLAPRVGSN